MKVTLSPAACTVDSPWPHTSLPHSHVSFLTHPHSHSHTHTWHASIRKVYVHQLDVENLFNLWYDVKYMSMFSSCNTSRKIGLVVACQSSHLLTHDLSASQHSDGNRRVEPTILSQGVGLGTRASVPFTTKLLHQNNDLGTVAPRWRLRITVLIQTRL